AGCVVILPASVLVHGADPMAPNGTVAGGGGPHGSERNTDGQGKADTGLLIHRFLWIGGDRRLHVANIREERAGADEAYSNGEGRPVEIEPPPLPRNGPFRG